MRAENKVVSLETAKKLKAAGFPQEMERRWREGGKLTGPMTVELVGSKPILGSADQAWSSYAAPDATEILELIIKHLPGQDVHLEHHESTGWQCSGCLLIDRKHWEDWCVGETQAEACAAAWLLLVEQGKV